MAWTSTQVTQNGNTTITWSIGPHASVSNHDSIVIKPVSGNSRIELETVNVKINPTNYNLRVRIIGSGAMAFRFAAEQMD